MTLNFPQKKVDLQDLFPSTKSSKNSLHFYVDMDMIIIPCLDWILLFVHKDKGNIYKENVYLFSSLSSRC